MTSTSSISPPTLLVVEDDAIILFDLKEVLENEGFSVLTAINPGQALLHLKNHRPDLILLDINLESELTGIDIAHYIDENNLAIPYIYLTSYSDKKTIEEVKHTFPAGYIAKPFHQAQLLSTIELVLADLKRRLTAGTVSPDLIQKKFNIELTDKEWAITQLLSRGLTNEQIGIQLNLSVNTVKFHIKNIYDKLEVHSRPELLIKLNKL